ncbi:helix-turn-helix domain-containing protein [Flintibacter sp. P01028]|uniref:helix-turn-helix domain-containing protein n=2 Tax=Clostridia TaxID=186801 RepID=UPI00204ECF61|nr:MAG TPA: repressor protein [Caudoviricetes sp.]
MEDLYKHIEGLGREHGYKNMTVLCKAAGVPRSTMSELNNGRSKDLSKPNAQKFADILGITLDEVYGEETKKAPTQEDEREITFDDFTFAMQNESKDLTEADKQILLSMAKQLNDARKKRNGESK